MILTFGSINADFVVPVPKLPQPGETVLDPFCGTGTTALVCAERGIACDTTDINPFLIWLAKAKARSYSSADLDAFTTASGQFRMSLDNDQQKVDHHRQVGPDQTLTTEPRGGSDATPDRLPISAP